MSSQSIASFEASEPADAQSASLLVGDLAKTASESQLRELFARFGRVVSMDIKRDRETSNSLGYAFVTLATRESAVQAKAALTGVSFLGRSLRLGFASRTTTLFVGDLDASVASEALRSAFQQFGDLIECFVKVGGKYAFVRFATRSEAEAAKHAMRGQVLGNRPIRVGWADQRWLKSCIHIAVADGAHQFPDQATLKQHFGRLGEVVSIIMPRTQHRNQTHAILHYDEGEAGEQSAIAAVSMMNGATINGIRVNVAYGRRQNHHKSSNGKRPNPSHFTHMHERGGASAIPMHPNFQQGNQFAYYQLAPLESSVLNRLAPVSRSARSPAFDSQSEYLLYPSDSIPWQFTIVYRSPYPFAANAPAVAFAPMPALSLSEVVSSIRPRQTYLNQ